MERRIDPLFRVEVLRKTQNPQQAAWLAMHQDHCEDYIIDEIENGKTISEEKAGEKIVEKALKFHHLGLVEHPQIVFSCGYFPHHTMVQGRTHRHTSWDVQSFRYTSQSIIDVANGDRDVEEVFYFRPLGFYTNRHGVRYEYTPSDKYDDKALCRKLAGEYLFRINEGRSEEHARDIIPQNIRQHFVVSMNARSLMHFLNLRMKADAQLEIQQLAELMLPHFQAWMPSVAEWYLEKCHKKQTMP